MLWGPGVPAGVLSLPYAEIREPFEAWYNLTGGKSRIQYYGGGCAGAGGRPHPLCSLREPPGSRAGLEPSAVPVPRPSGHLPVRLR